jgi:CBS domain-containing protein
MTEDPTTVDADTPIFKAQTIMKKKKIRRMPVMEKGKLVTFESLFHPK